MGREIRRVPKNWEHPKNDRGNYIPMFDNYYQDELNEWYNNHLLWLDKKHPDQLEGNGLEYKFYAEWAGDAPCIECYRTIQWTEEEANCYQMYEDVSEGTPVSPVFETLLLLEDWLVDEKGYERSSAHAFCESGWVPSFTISNGEIKSNINTL